MATAELALIYRMNGRALAANTAGVSHAQSLQAGASGANCMNWVVGHLLASRNAVHATLGLAPAWGHTAAERYARGSAPLTGDAAVPFDELLASWAASQAALLEGIARAPAELLDRALPEPGFFGARSTGELLAGLAFHEAYHVGQLGLLRRAAGLAGAIK